MVPHQRTTLTLTERSQRNSEDNKSTDENFFSSTRRELSMEMSGLKRFVKSSHFDEGVICNEDAFRFKKKISAISANTMTKLRFFYERVHVCMINIVFKRFAWV